MCAIPSDKYRSFRKVNRPRNSTHWVLSVYSMTITANGDVEPFHGRMRERGGQIPCLSVRRSGHTNSGVSKISKPDWNYDKISIYSFRAKPWMPTKHLLKNFDD